MGLFNQKQIFTIQRFSLYGDLIYFEGPIRYDLAELARMAQQLTEYSRIYSDDL